MIGTRTKLDFDPAKVDAATLDLAQLTPRQRQVFEGRFLTGTRPTLRALAVEMNLSRARVQQLEAAALRRLHRALSCCA